MAKVVVYRESDGSIVNFEVHTGLKSALETAREYAANPAYPDKYVVFTDKQTKLKTSQKDIEIVTESGIYMSCILRPSIFPSQASLLTSLSAAAMATALEEHTDKQVGIGWISDIYCDGVKIGGVTVEGKLDNFTTYEYIIVSFACALDEDKFPPRLADMVKKVFESDNTSVNMIIARNILHRFFKFYTNIKTPQKFMSTYTQKFALRGVKVKYRAGDKWKSHKVLGVDAKTGALIIDNGKDPEIYVTSPMLISTPKKIKIK